MSTRSLPRNAAGGRKITGLGAYVRENAQTFGAGTLTRDVALKIMGKPFSNRGGFAAHIGGTYGSPMVTSYPTVWKRITWHEPQECDRDCARHYTIAPNHPTSGNAHCRPMPCLPRAVLA